LRLLYKIDEKLPGERKVSNIPRTRPHGWNLLVFKVTTMEQKNEYVSRPVRIKLKKSTEIISGNIIFYDRPDDWGVLGKFTPTITVRLDDALKTETALNLLEVDMIFYL
jgi:hypothetical protein